MFGTEIKLSIFFTKQLVPVPDLPIGLADGSIGAQYLGGIRPRSKIFL